MNVNSICNNWIHFESCPLNNTTYNKLIFNVACSGWVWMASIHGHKLCPECTILEGP